MDYGKKFHVFERTQRAQGAKDAEGFYLQAAGTKPVQSAVTESYHQPAAAWLLCDEPGGCDCIVWRRGD